MDFVFKEKNVKPKAISESQKKENPASGIAQSAKLKAHEKEHGQKAQSELQNTVEKSRGTRAGKLGLFSAAVYCGDGAFGCDGGYCPDRQFSGGSAHRQVLPPVSAWDWFVDRATAVHGPGIYR